MARRGGNPEIHKYGFTPALRRQQTQNEQPWSIRGSLKRIMALKLSPEEMLQMDELQLLRLVIPKGAKITLAQRIAAKKVLLACGGDLQAINSLTDDVDGKLKETRELEHKHSFDQEKATQAIEEALRRREAAQHTDIEGEYTAIEHQPSIPIMDAGNEAVTHPFAGSDNNLSKMHYLTE